MPMKFTLQLTQKGAEVAQRLVSEFESQKESVQPGLMKLVADIYAAAGRDVGDPKEQLLASAMVAGLWESNLYTARAIIPLSVQRTENAYGHQTSAPSGLPSA
jgi:hypothetical protein